MWGTQILSGAAVWAAAGLLLRRSRFSGADEGAQEFAFDLRGDLIDGDAGFGEEGARVFDVVGAGWLEVDVGEARGGELGAVVVLFERPGDAADPKQHALADGVGALAVGDDIGDGERPPGRSTRKASRSTRSLSLERLMTQLERMTSTELSGSGMFSISPLRNSTLVAPAWRWFSRARASMSSVMSSP